MRQLLAWRAWAALLVFCAVAMVFGFLGGSAFDYEYDKRIQQVELLACGLTQFEDWSVAVQTDDRSRQLCADYILGRVDCDRVTRDDHEYLVNCRPQ
jgi:hypothetical protein